MRATTFLLGATLTLGASGLTRAGDAGVDKDPHPPGAARDARAAALAEEPPVNPFLADSPWPMSHRGPYNQASSPLAGPTAAEGLSARFVPTIPISITLAMGPAYEGGAYPVWGATIGDVFKAVDLGEGLTVISTAAREITPSSIISGAYTLVDSGGVFFVPQGTSIAAYGDRRRGDPTSPIRELRRYALPAEILGDEPDEAIVGIGLTWDGALVLATRYGLVGVISRDFQEATFTRLGEGEAVSNSLAVDEEGGIYIVTSQAMHRLQWTGRELSQDEAAGAWTAAYETGGDPQAGRLGEGSGSTPTLMGVEGEDRFVVITDGQELMHLVLFWRGAIPDGWQPIAPGKDRRIAAEVPVTFGDPQATHSVSEQSVLVRGYGAAVVNNDYAFDWLAHFDGLVGKALTVLISGYPANAPYGVERFTWDRSTRTLRSEWVNPEVSCPNGIPTLSAVSQVMYCVGQRGGMWTLEGLSWETGASLFSAPLGAEARYNSCYAATQVGAGGDILSGTFLGLVQVGE